MKKCSCVAIIPARYASSRLPGKPLIPIAGKPLIQHVFERVSASSQVQRTIIASDDQRIIEVCRGFGAESVLTTEKLISGTDRVAQVATQLGYSDDQIIINVQGDQPLIATQTISALASPFNNQDLNDCMLTVVTPLKEHEIHDPVHVKTVVSKSNQALYFSRAPIPYGRDYWKHRMYKHLGIYAYSLKFLKRFSAWPESELENAEQLEMLRVLDNDYPIQVIHTQHDSPEVDIPEDIERIELLLLNHPQASAHFAH